MGSFVRLAGAVALALVCSPALAADVLKKGIYNPDSSEGPAPRVVWVTAANKARLDITLDGTSASLKRKGDAWEGPLDGGSFLGALGGGAAAKRNLKVETYSNDTGHATITVGTKTLSRFWLNLEPTFSTGILKREPSLFRNLADLLKKRAKQEDITPQDVKALVGPELQDGKSGKLSATEVRVLEWVRHRVLGHGDNAATAEIDKHLWGDEHIARKFVLANAGDEDDKLFPGVDSGEDGLHAYLLDEKNVAERCLAFAKLWDPEDGKLQAFQYDASKHLLVALRSTFDEEDFYLGVVDKATGKGELLGGRMGVVDADSFIDKEELAKIVPKLDLEYIDHMELIDELVKGSTPLALFGN
ncbi:MAG: hypothetical protein ACAI25_07215 [Planctomycetota bacterium]